ncbi:hypothetical protein X727_02645 [Mesorhizobium sp. L103C119B0]|nr:hypothetical protein X771_29155 [Mesorhizobium sp. LSJC277A00]ESW76089.1 hypothetical protein X773_25785 [Mesorhizobium sp. LSJC285A00]ESX59267.1 hypothetical protein X761_00885 [Mesorhizobium sp. LSHC424B00]ESX72275.1 hypothetical protein X758_12185 [Mesorhizobium sp. LSHC416B00]ESY26346.1 hypothetical protein X751_00390 [Mesorhizobium sp. LNJC395A00]ESY31652.1 hypothetical protein X749_09355 [Mesorhizobium sp. LNJC391B00]ESZ73737.1 hypothetical protein X727_02645 [Mesorhizobium sp. L103C
MRKARRKKGLRHDDARSSTDRDRADAAKEQTLIPGVQPITTRANPPDGRADVSARGAKLLEVGL